jgi:CRP-like cAMP-binding protein
LCSAFLQEKLLNTVPRSPNRLLASLSASDFALLRPHLQAAELVQEVIVAAAGDPLTHAFFPHSGIISLVVNLSGGQMVEVASIGHDSLFGVSAALDGNISLTDAIVQLPGSASMIDVAQLQAVVGQSAAFRTALIRHAQALFVQAQQTAACNALHGVEARLARWLLRMRDLTGSDKLALTQDFVAQMIGVQRNSVSGVAHALQQAGIIRYNRGQIEITNPEGLKQASCECYEAVKAQHDRLLNTQISFGSD